MKYSCQILFFILVGSVLVHAQNEKDRPTTFEDDLSFGWRQDRDTVKLMVSNKLHAPIEVQVYERASGMILQSLLLEKLDSVLVLEFEAQNLDSIINHVRTHFRLAYFIGHPDQIVPDTQYLYRLPFKKGKKYEVSQSWNGKSSHRSEQSRYALDFQLDIGEPVHAAREGIVVKAIDWFTKKGGPELRDAANRIVILHDDGTLASYVHLQYKGVLVSEGERVSRGQKIGISGLTGFTRGPHLHFVLRKERDISIPVYFEGYEGRKLKAGRRYKVK